MPNPNQMISNGAKTMIGMFCDRMSNGYVIFCTIGRICRMTANAKPTALPMMRPRRESFVVARISIEKLGISLNPSEKI